MHVHEHRLCVVAVRVGGSGSENSSRMNLGDWVWPDDADVAGRRRRGDGHVGVVMGHGLVFSSQPNNVLKFFSSKLYKIRARLLDFLVQNVSPFTTPIDAS